MSNRWRENGGRISTARIKARLRQLRGFEPPGRLCEELMAAVPAVAGNHASRQATPRWFRALRYAAVAAALIVAASVLVQRYTPLGGAPRIIADINDRSGRLDLIDQNRPRPRDINVSDNNAVP